MMADEPEGYYWDRDDNLLLRKDDGTFELVSTHADMGDTVIALRAENAALKAQYYEMKTCICPDCYSDGEINGSTCVTCNGHGVLFTKPEREPHP